MGGLMNKVFYFYRVIGTTIHTHERVEYSGTITSKAFETHADFDGIKKALCVEFGISYSSAFLEALNRL
jgi:hypothetical protein